MFGTNGDKKSSPYSKNKVASIITQFDGTASAPAPAAPKDNGSNGLSLLFEVIKEFNARLGDELDLKVGQKIQVISDDSEYNDGWYMGKNLDTGNVGLYPKSFTQIVQNSQGGINQSSPYPKPSLLRSRSRRLNSPTSQQNSPVTPSQQQISSFGPPSAGLGAHLDSPTVSSNDSLVPQRTQNSTANNSYTRQSSVHNNTMKDIDNALAELTSVGGDLVPSQVETWTPEQVSSYFSSIGVDVESAGQFARHKITGAILLELELSHLKELDISSFGTRFEIFKAIEALKMETRNKNLSSASTQVTSTPINNSLMPPPSVSRVDTAPLMGHQRKRSQSMDDIKLGAPDDNLGTPTQNRSRQPSSDKRQIQRQSYVFKAAPEALDSPQIPVAQYQPKTNVTSSSSSSSTSLQQQSNEQMFTSPRKAPAPPVDAQKLNTTYKFGAGSASNDNGLTQQFSRLSTLPEKERERQHSTTSRPTSSIYHSRSSSIPLASMSPTRGHKHSNSTANKDKNNAHKRHSSVFSFISGGGSINVGNDPYKNPEVANINESSKRNSLVNLLSSPSKISLMKKKNANESDDEDNDLTDLSPSNEVNSTPKVGTPKSPLKISSPYRRSVSAQVASPQQAAAAHDAQQKRATSEASRMKSLRNASSTHIQTFGRSKTKTSAFKEGIQFVSPDDAIKTADHYGWMYKKGSLNFKKRYFTLHGTRLSYFQSLKDTHERGLIDIQAHKVLPTDNNDLKTFLASSTTAARYSFKLIPPAPGSKKGLTFTQPKVHFFAVGTKEEMRAWMAALMKATIDLDETVPVVSSYTSATISLKQAQALQQKSSERALQFSNKAGGDDTLSSSDTNNTSYETPKLQQQSRLSSRLSTKNGSSEFDDYSNTLATTTAGDDDESGGFDSPYLLASGLLSPKSPNSNYSEDTATNTAASTVHSNSGSVNRSSIQRARTFGTNPVPMITNLENGTTSNSSAAAVAAANGAFKKKN